MATASAPSPASRIDALMERASRALVETRYFECERLCRRAIAQAAAAGDYDRIARAVLPLQECRRIRRQAACDAGPLPIFDRPAHLRRKVRAGCALLQPPLTPAHAASLRAAAEKAGVPLLVVTREAMTPEGLWPLVAAAPGRRPAVVRALVAPPRPLKRVQCSPTRDRLSEPPPVCWFVGAAEALSAAALRLVHPQEPAADRVPALLALLDAHPDDEALHQALGAAAREAAASGALE